MEGNLYNIIAKNLPLVLQTVCPLYPQMHPSDIFVCTPHSQGFQISLLTCALGLWEVLILLANPRSETQHGPSPHLLFQIKWSENRNSNKETDKWRLTSQWRGQNVQPLMSVLPAIKAFLGKAAGDPSCIRNFDDNINLIHLFKYRWCCLALFEDQMSTSE